MQGREPVTGKMPVPQVLLLKWKHYIPKIWSHAGRMPAPQCWMSNVACRRVTQGGYAPSTAPMKGL